MESELGLAQVIVHEMGHYLYGLYDEYAQGTDASRPSAPLDTDTPKNSLMHDQYKFPTFSTAGDYADPNTRKTAQARVYGNADGTGGSNWEVLSRANSGQGFEAPGQLAAGRRAFAAFAGANYPTQADLKKPQLPDAQLPNINYLDPKGPKQVLLLDSSTSTANFAKIVEAAKGVVGKAPADGELAIYTSQLNAAKNGYNQSASFKTDDDGKAKLIEALNKLTPQPTVSPNSDDSLKAAVAGVLSVRGGMDEPASIAVFAAEDFNPTASIGDDARNKKVTLNVVRITENTPSAKAQSARMQQVERRAATPKAMAQASTLEALAKKAGGAYDSARTSTEAAKEASRALASDQKGVAVLTTKTSDVLAAGKSFQTTFQVAPTKVDKEPVVTWYFDPTDAKKLSFKLTGPDGKVYTNTAPGDLEFDLDADEGVADFFIPDDLTAKSREGVWTAAVTSNATTADVIDFEVTSESGVNLQLEFIQKTSSQPARITAQFVGNGYPVAGANLVANIYNAETGVLVASNLAMVDNGQGVDAIANDGKYTVGVGSNLLVGNYYVEVLGNTTASSVFTSNVTFARGEAPASQSTGLLSRSGDTEFQVTQSDVTPVVVDSSTGGGSGGGCTTGGQGQDGSLVLLALAALGGLWARTRRRQGVNGR